MRPLVVIARLVALIFGASFLVTMLQMQVTGTLVLPARAVPEPFDMGTVLMLVGWCIACIVAAIPEELP